MPNAASGTTIAVILNKQSGSVTGQALVERIQTAFNQHSVTAQILPCSPDIGIKDLARSAIADGCTTLVAGGGDGTISAVASVAVESGVTFGVLPLGTLNHFAKDLKIPLDIEEAVATIAAGNTARVDVGEVNGHIFVNNSSLGLYPHFVRHRRNQRRLGHKPWSALVLAVWTVVGRYPFLYVHIKAHGHRVTTRTPLVFIGNNTYRIEGLKIGSRESLRDGQLSLYMTRQVGVTGFLWLALKGLVGRLRNASDFICEELEELCIEVRRRKVHIALDGEVYEMEPPLNYRCRPGVLRVIVPMTELRNKE